MTTSQRYKSIIEWFGINAANATSELNFSSPYELIVAVVLSAQCTDKRVNLTTPALFEAFPTVEALSKATAAQIFPYIKSISYPNNKAKHLEGLSRKVVDVYGGQIPQEVEDLMSLPGVGRKTACVVSSILFDNPVIAVDTHVYRVSRRLGLSKGTTPLAVEKDLERGIPAELRHKAHHWILLHGRYVCTSQKPHCSECGLKAYCKAFEKSDFSF